MPLRPLFKKDEEGRVKKTVSQTALWILREIYNEDMMWVEMTHAERGRMDRKIHRLLCAAKFNHQCAVGHRYEPKPYVSNYERRTGRHSCGCIKNRCSCGHEAK